jgi:predicted PurR-regulated permease PerM
VLWGALVAVLNFVPYIGAITSMGLLAMAGIQTFDSLPQALIAPAILGFLVVLSAAVIAPFILGRRLSLNPVAIFVSILVWGWLWGIVGVLLAVPLLATVKIVCERIEPLNPFAEFLTT